MARSILNLSRKQYLLTTVFLLTFVIGLLQAIPFTTTSNTQQDIGSPEVSIAEPPKEVPILKELEEHRPVVNYQTALDPPVYDYVDTHDYDGYGSTTNFAYMQSGSTQYATLTEAPSSTATLEHEDYWYPWMSEDYSATDWCEVEIAGRKAFHLEENGGQGSSTSNYAGVNEYLIGNSGGILSPTYDLSSADYFVFSCYIYDYGLNQNDELMVFFRDNSGSYDYKFYWDQCGAPVDNWRYIELTITDSQYLYNGFRVRYEARSIHWGQATGVDNHKIVAHGSCQLDQRFRFTNVDYNEYSMEYLEIEFDISVTEPLIIECWDTVNG